jgi:hydroxymethylglutaryl-CoA lyase
LTTFNDVNTAITSTEVAFREVGLREGFQSDGMVVPTRTKLEYFGRLKAAGVTEMNVCSFSHPGTMPQMADAEVFLRSLGDMRDGVELSGLCPNERALERALVMASERLLDRAFVIFSESESVLALNRFTDTHAKLIPQVERATSRASEAGLKTSVFVSNSYGCSVEGRIDPARVVEHAQQLWEMEGVNELIISDSVGQADPLQVLGLLTQLAEVLPTDQRICVHFHDTRGCGLANIFAALSSPFENIVIDGAFGGWGGDFPFVPEAFGNVASEDVLEMLVGLGFGELVNVREVMNVTRDYHELSRRPICAKLVDASPIAWKRAGAPANV